jgi:hypothetical protein
MKEWWTLETLFTTLENNRKWNLMISFAYKMETNSCFFQYVLFDITSGKYVLHKDIDDEIDKFTHKKNIVDLKYKKSFVTGLYPNYHIHIEDEEQGFIADMDYKAKSIPHWIAQDKTNGFLPIGFNYYRYGFLPNCDLNGTLKFQEKLYKIYGKGYIEHAYGNWSYEKPINQFSNIKKTLSIYKQLGKWWLSENKLNIPKNIEFTTENNAFGYDWLWGIFDNGWSLFFGNSMFWISKGPSFGALYITPDGENYWEFCHVRFHYNKLIYIKKFDVYYPCDMELFGKLDDKEIHIRFWKTTDSYEYYDPFRHDRFYKAFILCEMPGRMQGTFSDNEKTINLTGDCKIVPLRQSSAIGHNSLKFDFLHPPNGIGIDTELISHYLRKKISAKIHLTPRPCFKFNIKKLNEEDFSNYMA